MTTDLSFAINNPPVEVSNDNGVEEASQSQYDVTANTAQMDSLFDEDGGDIVVTNQSLLNQTGNPPDNSLTYNEIPSIIAQADELDGQIDQLQISIDNIQNEEFQDNTYHPDITSLLHAISDVKASMEQQLREFQSNMELMFQEGTHNRPSTSEPISQNEMVRDVETAKAHIAEDFTTQLKRTLQ